MVESQQKIRQFLFEEWIQGGEAQHVPGGAEAVEGAPREAAPGETEDQPDLAETQRRPWRDLRSFLMVSMHSGVRDYHPQPQGCRVLLLF